MAYFAEEAISVTRAALSIGGVERGNFNAEAGKSESTGLSVVSESGIL